jgi:hypothetical protein
MTMSKFGIHHRTLATARTVLQPQSVLYVGIVVSHRSSLRTAGSHILCDILLIVDQYCITSFTTIRLFLVVSLVSLRNR